VIAHEQGYPNWMALQASQEPQAGDAHISGRY
jgi:hypothetical protein